MTSRARLVVAVMFASLAAFLTSASPGAASSGPAVDHAGGPEDRIVVTLRADGSPAPDGVALLTLEAQPLLDAPDLIVTWVLPEGVVLEGEAVERLGPVAAGETVTVERRVRFPEEGTFKIAVNAAYQPVPAAEFAASGVLFFTIDEAGSAASDRDPEVVHPHRTIMPAEISVDLDRAAVQRGDPCFTVRGFIQRTDRRNAPGGRVATTVRVHNAPVEIRESDTFFDDSYGTVLTNEDGEYSVSFCDDDGWFDDELEIYVRLRAELRSGGEDVVEVEDSSWIDEVYEFETNQVASEGGTITFNIGLNEAQSEIFNIADAAFDAWTFWNESGGEDGGDSIFDGEAEIHWEPGYGDSGSYYDSFWNEITVADDPSDPDMWDDSVIIHEWGHMADDFYSCDDNPGGQHFVFQLVDDPELSWGEGYPDYYQSAVRAATGDPDGHRYMDFNGAGMPGINVSLETWDVDNPMVVSILNEFAIAAALWDLNDNLSDGQDIVAHGHSAVQSVYTSDVFEDEAYGFWDDTCTFRSYIRSWVKAGRPADTQTAAAVEQNTGLANLGSMAVARSDSQVEVARGAQSPVQSTEYKWWNQLTWVIDNSASMAGPKFNAIKTVMEEQLNDLAMEPEGTEFNLDTFNQASSSNTTVFKNQFFPDNITDEISGLSTIGGADPQCPVRALDALSDAVAGEQGMDAWLFTDGDTIQSPSVESLRQLLVQRDIRASFAVMGLCPPAARAAGAGETEAEGPPVLGAAAALLGPEVAAGLEETPGGVVPYLLTAIGSGGQFLFVPSANVNNAADILRAQITNSAGAGKWSDYVSHHPTYRYDDLASWEYNWISAHTSEGGTAYGQPNDTFVQVPLPAPFTFFGRLPSGGVRVYEDGHLTFNSFPGGSNANTPLPSANAPSRALFPLWDDLGYVVICAAGDESAQGCGPESGIFSKLSDDGEWFVIEWYNYYSSAGGGFFQMEVLLNMTTGEIRFQYPEGMAAQADGSATIGLQDTSTNGVQVSYNDVNGAIPGDGYKFIPVPPQPSKTYSVTVDSTMDSVGYLLTGYSGTFEPLEIRPPGGGAPVTCGSEGVLCLSMEGGRIQYVQADVNGQTGVWTATVATPPPNGSGTFSFTSFAASPISPESIGEHIRSTAAGGPIFVHLGQPASGNVLTGWFMGPDNNPFGTEFMLYDDGAHDDALAGDGLFGSDPYTPPGAGTGYLWLRGTVEGTEFVRSAPAPYTFQPIRVTSLGDRSNYGGETLLPFEAENLDDANHCYWVQARAPDGWTAVLPGFLPIICLDAGQSESFNIEVTPGPGSPSALPSGTSGEITVSVVEIEEGVMSDSASATVTRRRAPASIVIHNPNFYIRPDGATAELEFHVLDSQGTAVADGTVLNLSASIGTISPESGETEGGIVRATYTSGPEGEALIRAESGGVIETTHIDVGMPKPNQINLVVADGTLPPTGLSTTQVTATVHDRYGEPVANQMVRIGVEGDMQMGTIEGGDVISGPTNGAGQLVVTYTAGGTAGVVGVRAELLYPGENGDPEVVHEARVEIRLEANHSLYLPMVRREE